MPMPTTEHLHIRITCTSSFQAEIYATVDDDGVARDKKKTYKGNATTQNELMQWKPLMYADRDYFDEYFVVI